MLGIRGTRCVNTPPTEHVRQGGGEEGREGNGMWKGNYFDDAIVVNVCGTHYLGEKGIGILQGMVDAAEAFLEILLGEPCGSLDIELLEE